MSNLLNKTIAQQVNEKASDRNVPLNAVIELTYRCNQQCRFCFQRKYPATPDLPSSFWMNVLDQLAEAGTLYCAFTGGEPFIHAGFMDILSHARKKAFAVSIISNGTLIDKRIAGQLSGAGIMDIGISLLASTPGFHDRLSGVPGSFTAALNSIGMLVKSGVKVLIKHTVTKDNFGEYNGLSKMADELGCLLEYDTMVVPSSPGTVSPSALTAEELREFYRDTHVSPPENSSDSHWRLHCDAGRSVCGISPSGIVYRVFSLRCRLGIYSKKALDRSGTAKKPCGSGMRRRRLAPLAVSALICFPACAVTVLH